jgi:hypothetical protein
MTYQSKALRNVPHAALLWEEQIDSSTKRLNQSSDGADESGLTDPRGSEHSDDFTWEDSGDYVAD